MLTFPCISISCRHDPPMTSPAGILPRHDGATIAYHRLAGRSPGVVFLAPAGRHLTFTRASNGSVSTRLDVSPLDTPHRPSIDVMFRSAADVFGDRVLGIVMTGMGDDGREGSAWIKARGGCILTEAEETCVVYGMPRSVVEAGLSDQSVPLHRLTEAIVERI